VKIGSFFGVSIKDGFVVIKELSRFSVQHYRTCICFSGKNVGFGLELLAGRGELARNPRKFIAFLRYAMKREKTAFSAVFTPGVGLRSIFLFRSRYVEISGV
jgi:hypothetical protein